MRPGRWVVCVPASTRSVCAGLIAKCTVCAVGATAPALRRYGCCLTEVMLNPLSHWELMVSDPEPTKAFYAHVFDWTFVPAGPE